MIRRYLFTTLCILFLHLTVRADDYPRDWNVDIQHYTFKLLLTDATNQITGQATLDVYFKAEVGQVVLDLIQKNGSGNGMNVSGVKIEGMTSTFTHKDNKLAIIPGQPFEKGQRVKITIDYEGVPSDGLIISKNKFGDRTFFGDNWPDRARHWLPCVDHPSDKAGVDFIVQAPEHYQVIANGIKLEESNIENDLKITHWHEEVDVSTKVMVIGVARFAVQLSGIVDNIPIEAWVYPQNRKEGFYDYEMAVKVLDYFHSHVGDYSYKKLANVQSKTRYGGMENASNIFYSESSVTGKRAHEPLIAHEIAHQWFGNSASEKDWHHIWLSEGFATYFTNLYMEHTHGVDILQERLKSERTSVINFYDREQVPIVNTEISNYNKLLNTNSYQKGGWVLHMLRNKIGDEAFWQGIRNYYAKFQNSNALTEDLKNEMESSSSMELDTFFDQWIFGIGQPELRVTWDYKSGSNELEIDIEQVKKETQFEFQLEIEVLKENGSSTIYQADVDNSTQSFTFDCDSKPSSLVLDPEVKLLFNYASISN